MAEEKEYFYDKIYTDRCPDLNIGILEGKAAVIDDNGKPLTDFIYEDIYCDFEKGFIRKSNQSNYFGSDYIAVRKINGKMGIINNRIQTIIDFIYDDISIEFGNISDIYAIVQKNYKYGIIKLEPVFKVITDCIYEDIYFDYYAGIIAKKDDKYGILNTNGEVIKNFEYAKIEPQNTTILLKKDGKYKIEKIKNLEEKFNELLK